MLICSWWKFVFRSKQNNNAVCYIVCCYMLTALKYRVPTLTHVIPSQDRDSVTAVTSLDDDVFILRFDSQQVEVYDAATFTLQRHISVDGLGPYTPGMTACDRNKCLYLTNHFNNSVHRVELSGSNAVKKWSVADGPRGLSVNIAHNLVVACYRADKLQEYTTHGSLVREICLQAGVTDPWHAIQLSTGDYVVSQSTSSGVVSVVGVDGQVESCQSTDQRAVYKNWLCRLSMEYNVQVVCVWMSHEVDFMSVNLKNNIECWSLMVLDCNGLPSCCYNTIHSSSYQETSLSFIVSLLL